MSNCIFKTGKRLNYQIQTASRLVKALTYNTANKRIEGAMLGDGVGLGKTYTSLFSAFSYMSPYLKRIKKLNAFWYTSLLIIVPNPVLLKKWRSEIEPYAKATNLFSYIRNVNNTKRIRNKMSLMVSNIKELKDVKNTKSSGWSVILITYHQLKTLDPKRLERLKKVTGFVIIDEAHHLRENSLRDIFENDPSRRELLHYSSKSHKRKFLLLTATPFQKSIEQLRPLFEDYYLNKIEDYENLNKYVNESVRPHIASFEAGMPLGKIIQDKKLIEKKLRKYLVINTKEGIKPRSSMNHEAYINGGERVSHGSNINNINERIRHEIKVGKKALHDAQKNKKGRSHLSISSSTEVEAAMNSPFDHELYLHNYLKYRFSTLDSDKQHVERDLQRFTSFTLPKHKKIVPEHFGMKAALLRSIVHKHFRSDPRDRYWNRKFIIFCDDVNEIPSKKDQMLHKQLKDSCETVLSNGLKAKPIVAKPNFKRVLEKCMKNTKLKNDLFYKRDGITLKHGWKERLKNWSALFQASRLYKYYGSKMKEYYELRFEDMIKRYAGIAFLAKKIDVEYIDNIRTKKGRELYFKFLFDAHSGEAHIDKEIGKAISYDRDSLLEMWQFHYQSIKGSNKKKIVTVTRELNTNFKNELRLILQQWEGILPKKVNNSQAPLVEVVRGGQVGAELLKRFQSPLEPYAIVVGSASEEGIDLQAFTKGIIHYVFHWSPGKMVQREGRVDRIGRAVDRQDEYKIFNNKRFKSCLDSNRNLHVHYLLIPDTYDERKYYRLRERQFLYNLLVPTNMESEELHFGGDEKSIAKLAFRLGVSVTHR